MLEFPHVSVEVQVRFITYSSTQLPATLTSDHATDGVGSHASSAVAVPVAAGSVLATHEMVVFAGQSMSGGVKSSTVIVCVHVAVLLQPSVAVQVRMITYSLGQSPY